MLIEQRQQVVDAPPAIVYAELLASAAARLAGVEPVVAPAVRPTGSSAAWDFAGGGATRSISESGTPSISGAWKRSKRTAWCACGRR